MRKSKDYKEPYDNVVLGPVTMVGLYEICFRAGMENDERDSGDARISEGNRIAKIILKTAYQAGMVDNEEMWLQALRKETMWRTPIMRI